MEIKVFHLLVDSPDVLEQETPLRFPARVAETWGFDQLAAAPGYAQQKARIEGGAGLDPRPSVRGLCALTSVLIAAKCLPRT